MILRHTITRRNVDGCGCIVVGLFSMKDNKIEEKLHTAQTIVESQGGTILCTVVQRRGVSRSRKAGGAKKLSSPLSSVTWIGKGKAEELCELAHRHSADIIIFLNDLSTKQRENWAQLTNCRILTCVII